MTRALSQFCKKEYARFRVNLINEWAIDETRLDHYDQELRLVHKRYLSLACSATIIGIRAQRNEYIENVVEVSHLGVVLAVKGLENSSCVLLRQSIELVLKHVYFSTHPVEYEWTCSRDDYRDLTFQRLLEFFARTDQCRRLNCGSQVCDRINYWYGTLSRHVHVHSKGFLGYRTVSSAHTLSTNAMKKLTERTRELWPLLTLMMLVCFPKRFLKASSIEQKLIRSILSKEQRNDLDQYLRVGEG